MIQTALVSPEAEAEAANVGLEATAERHAHDLVKDILQKALGM